MPEVDSVNYDRIAESIMTQTLERPIDRTVSDRGHQRQARHTERKLIPEQGTRFFVAWYDDPLVFRSNATSIDEAALEFARVEDQLERDGVPMTIEALEGLYGDRPLVVWEMPQEGTALVNALWFREGELDPVDALMRARVTYWMEDRLTQPQTRVQNRTRWMLSAVVAVAAIAGLTVIVWPMLRGA
jgi:hypothetical protein